MKIKVVCKVSAEAFSDVKHFFDRMFDRFLINWGINNYNESKYNY